MTPWIIGNWKLNPATVEQARSLAKQIAEQAQTLQNCQLMLAPSSVHLSAVNSFTANTKTTNIGETLTVGLAAQDICAHTLDTGAYTGDNSAEQLKDIGATWVIIGHSERRYYYSEDNTLLFNKALHSLKGGLGVIFCIGESEAQYDSGNTQVVLSEQLHVIRDLVNEYTKSSEGSLSNHLIIAYEPVWAIGTGKVPSVDDVANVHQEIRAYLGNLDASLNDVPIIYGGSVKPDNAAKFAGSPMIDGVLVGGAALKVESFIDIARAFDNR